MPGSKVASADDGGTLGVFAGPRPGPCEACIATADGLEARDALVGLELRAVVAVIRSSAILSLDFLLICAARGYGVPAMTRRPDVRRQKHHQFSRVSVFSLVPKR